MNYWYIQDDTSKKYFAEWKKPGDEEHILYDSMYMKFCNSWKQSLVTESKSVVAYRGGWGTLTAKGHKGICAQWRKCFVFWLCWWSHSTHISQNLLVYTLKMGKINNTLKSLLMWEKHLTNTTNLKIRLKCIILEKTLLFRVGGIEWVI